MLHEGGVGQQGTVDQFHLGTVVQPLLQIEFQQRVSCNDAYFAFLHRLT